MRKKINLCFQWLQDKSLLFKIFITYIISLSIIGVIGYSYYIFNNIKSIDREVTIYKKNLIREKKTFVSNVVNIAIKGMDVFYENYKKGIIDEKTAQENSIKFIDSIRYVDKEGNSYGYIWLNTLDGVMILDPPKPELNGINVWDFRDKKGVYLFREMTDIINLKGEGFVNYCWSKLESKSSKKCFPKISFVKYFPQWQWIVGSGFYLDDIDRETVKYRQRIEKDILRTVVHSLIFGIVATTIAGFIFFLIVFYITSHLKKISELSVKLSEDEVTPDLKLPYSSNDEIGQLISNFNLFIDESYKLIKFKKTIEEDVNLDMVYNRITNLLTNEFNIKKFTLYEVNNSKNSMKPVKISGELCCKQEICIDMTICRAARTAHVIESAENKRLCMAFSCDDKYNYCCIPLIVGGNVGNVLQLLFEKHEHNFKDINRLKKFLNGAAPVIETKRLLEQLKDSTLKDPLTGLYNRRFLDESAEIFASSTVRRKSNAGILMCDIDFFKKVNDIYGHNVGDRVLKEVAQILKNSVRESDIVVRFGGEEFLVLLQDITEENAVLISEKIRKNVEAKEVHITGNIIKKTLSIGISIFPVDSEKFWQCIKYSDVALYKAKATGRNKVVRFEASMWKEEEF